MQIKLWVAILFACLLSAADAQIVTVQLTLKTTGKDSIPGATIQLYSLPSGMLLQTQLNQPVKNTFKVAANKSYRIEVTAVGFDTLQKDISVTNKPVFITLELTANYGNLKSVTVVAASKPLMRQEDDKTIVDAEQLANTSTNAYEVLEKVPGAVVDQDGNVYLNSSKPATVYINGVEMRMSTEDIASLLKSLPAGSVSKIEIIRTPSARYDAANSGGIINIVLKKGVEIGTAGSVNIRMDQGIYNTATTGFSLNKSFGKSTTYLSYQYSHRNYYDDIRSTRIITSDTILTQSSYTKYSPITNYAGGGMNIVFSKKFTVGYDIRVTATGNNSTAQSNNEVSNSTAQNKFLQTQSPITNNGNSLVISNTLTSKYKIDSTGSEWTNEIDYTYFKNNNTQLYNINYLLPANVVTTGDGHVNGRANMVDIKSDLSLQLPQKFILETGLKLSKASNNNAALYYIQNGNQPERVDSFQTNTFSYKENIGSAYLQLSKLYHGYILKAGLRLEYTDMTGNQIVPQGAPFTIKRTDLFPYFYVRRNLFKVLGYPLIGNIIFRRSILRPGYDQLNPFPKFVDQFTYEQGNPLLQPQFTTNYEVNATYSDFPVFALGVNNTKNVFSPVTYQNETSKIAFRTFDNLGKYKEIYSRLFGGIPAGHRYFMYIGVQFNYIQYNGTYENQPLKYSRDSWTFFSGQQFKATPTLNFNVNAWMYVNGFRLFNQLKTMGQLNVSATKTLYKKKLSIIVSGTDILKTNKSIFHLQQGSVLVDGSRIQDSRRFAITLRYNFGLNHAEEKKPAFTQPPVENNENQ